MAQRFQANISRHIELEGALWAHPPQIVAALLWLRNSLQLPASSFVSIVANPNTTGLPA